jgi:hypothetical protein
MRSIHAVFAVVLPLAAFTAAERLAVHLGVDSE